MRQTVLVVEPVPCGRKDGKLSRSRDVSATMCLSILASRDDFTAAACAQGGEDAQRDIFRDELDVPVGKEKVGTAGVETVRLIIVPPIDAIQATGRRTAALQRPVGVAAIQAERTFAVRPADALVVATG